MATFRLNYGQALTFISGGPIILVSVSRGVVAQGKVAAFYRSVLLLGTFFHRFRCLFQIGFFFLLELLFFFQLFFVNVTRERDRMFLPITNLFFFRFILIRFSRGSGLTTSDYRRFLFIFNVVRFARFFGRKVFQASFLFFRGFTGSFFAGLLICFTFFTRGDNCFNANANNYYGRLPLQLCALQFEYRGLRLITALWLIA